MKAMQAAMQETGETSKHAGSATVQETVRVDASGRRTLLRETIVDGIVVSSESSVMDEIPVKIVPKKKQQEEEDE